uniref:non-specific serine/threonine protein kinase n=1 Tax=Gouania willdenowi TaxID=441366 RepID=A0A8C5DG42_GOUWI
MVNPKTRTWPSIPSFSLSSTGSHSKVSSTHSDDSFFGVQEYSCHHPDAIKTTFHRDSTVLSSRKEFTSKYLEEEMLGQGGFSQVYAGDCWSDFTPVAIKHIPKKKVQFVRVNCHGNVYNEILEVVLMKQAAGLLCDGSFENPAVIGLMDIFDLESEVIIVMERLTDTVDGYDYYTQKRRIPEDQVKVIFKQIVNISLTMHKNGIFHRDLKLNNILVDSSKGTPEIRVIDFGCGDFVENEPFKNFCGTPAFSPPEVLRGETYMAEPTTVWQIGAMMYIICARTKFDTLVYMKRGKKVLKNVSKQCNDFLNKCLALNPKNRATLEDLRLHPWLKKTAKEVVNAFESNFAESQTPQKNSNRREERIF